MPDGQFADYPVDKEGGPARKSVRLYWDKEGGLAGGARSLPVKTKKEDRRAGSLMLGAKKENLPKGRLACSRVFACLVGTEEDLPEGQSASSLSGRAFAYREDKEGGPAGGSGRFCWEQRRSTCGRAFAYLGTKKEDLLEGQFACPGHREIIRPAGRPVRLSWTQRW